MPAYITDNDPLAERIDHLADSQPAKPSRSTMIEMVLDEAAAAFEQSGDPKAWRYPAPPAPPARENTDRGSDVSVNTQPISQGSSSPNGSHAKQEVSGADPTAPQPSKR